MKKSKYSITIKVLFGYLLIAAFGAVTIWFVYNKVVELRKPNPEAKISNQKMALISEAATRLYTTEGISRSIIQNNDADLLPEFHHSIDTISKLIDSLKSLYVNTLTHSELDSISQLLIRKEANLHELLALRKANGSNSYYDRVLKRFEKTSYLLGSSEYKEMVDNLKPAQKQVILDYLKYAEKEVSPEELFQQDDSTQKLTQKTADSIVNAMKQILMSLNIKEQHYQQQLSEKENKLLANDQKISHRLRLLRNKIEQEELKKSLARVKSTRVALDQTSIIVTVFGVGCVITFLIFGVMIIRDTNRSQRYRKELEEAKAYAEHLLKSREQIMATVTHDLRSPLNSILGYSDLLTKSDLGSKQNNYVRQLKKSSAYTIRLVNDLLDISRLDAGKIPLEQLPFSPKSLIEESIAITIPMPDPKQLTITVDVEEALQHMFLSDPFRIRQVLTNLIGNAYKFTETGEITIAANLEQIQDQNYLKIAVKDSGIGISKVQQAVIFEEFSQADSSTQRHYGGSGLGLAISQKLVKLLGGTISVDSERGIGSCFEMNIPVQPTEKESKTSQEKKVMHIVDAQNCKVLVIDDDEAQRNLTQEVLKAQGFKIQTAQDGQEGLKLIEEQEFSIVLTDIQMPNLDGFGVVKKLKENPSYAQIPVIALSGEANKTKQLYLDKGFSDYLLKPYDADELLKILAQQLGLKTSLETLIIETSPNQNTLYDLTNLNLFTDGDKESLKGILESLIESTDDSLQHLKKAYAEKNKQKVSFTAHKMLPMLRQIEAHSVQEPLEELERNADSLSEEILSNHVEFIMVQVPKLLEALKEDIKNL